jgi:hypothetical protein
MIVLDASVRDSRGGQPGDLSQTVTARTSCKQNEVISYFRSRKVLFFDLFQSLIAATFCTGRQLHSDFDQTGVANLVQYQLKKLRRR